MRVDNIELYGDGAGTGNIKTALTASYTVNTDAWSTKETTTITGIIINPTKATTRTQDFTRYKMIGPKIAQIQFYYTALTIIGASAGGGQYLFKLPTGLSFDTTDQPLYTGDNSSVTSNNVTAAIVAYSLPTAGNLTNTTIDSTTAIYVVPYSATTYRIWYAWNSTSLTYESTVISANFGPLNAVMCIMAEFTATIA